MAGLIFPTNPTLGDVFPIAPDTPIWECVGTVPSIWDKLDYGPDFYATRMVASASPPTDPLDNDQWYNINTGKIYVWYTDTDSSQWAES